MSTRGIKIWSIESDRGWGAPGPCNRKLDICLEVTMHERMKLITAQGKQILLVDLSKCSAGTVEDVARKVPDYVTTQPLRSVLLLADFTGASVDLEATRVLKESAVFNKPHIKKSAWVGVSLLSREFHDEIRKFSSREVPLFNTMEEAVSWLVRD
jgi:hypothetical protein